MRCLLVALAAHICLAKVALEWRLIQDDDFTGNRPPPLRGATATRLGSKVFVFGGWDGKNVSDNTWILDGKSWSLFDYDGVWKPLARERHAAAAVNNNLYVYGGELTNLGPMKVFDALDIVTMQWRHVKTTGNRPPQLSRHTLTAIRSKLYMFGGISGLGHVNEHLYCFDTLTGTWELVATSGLSPHRRASHAAAAVGDILYIMGGSVSLLLDKPYGDLHAFDTVNNKWTTLMSLGAQFPPLEGHTACVFGRQIVWFGGHDGHRPRNDVIVLDTGAQKVTRPEVSGQKPEGRVLASAVELPSRMLVLGGVMAMEASVDFYGDMYVMQITRVPDIEEGDDNAEDQSPDKINPHDAALSPSTALALESTMTDDELAEMYIRQHPEKANMAREVINWEHKFANATMNLENAKKSIIMDKLRSAPRPSMQLAAIQAARATDPKKAQEAFTRGMEMGLQIETLLQEADVTGQLGTTSSPSELKALRKRPEVVEARHELAEALERLQAKVSNDHNLAYQLDQALREAEEHLSEKAKVDAEILKQAEIAIRKEGGDEVMIGQKIENLHKSDLAINAYKEGVLSRVSHMLRLLDNPTTANMLMKAIEAIQLPQATEQDPAAMAAAEAAGALGGVGAAGQGMQWMQQPQ